jgi:hypothetical protein
VTPIVQKSHRIPHGILFVWGIIIKIVIKIHMIKRISGNPKIEYFAKAASTAFPQGSLVYANGSGYLIPADATSGDHLGILLYPVAATDADYAVATKVAVDVISPEDVFEADVETGTFTAAMVGNRYDLVADGDALDVSATAKKVVTIVGFISSSKALIKVNAVITSADVATS